MHAHILIASHLSGNINSEDQRALNEWLKESEINKTEFKRLKKLWDLSQKQKQQKDYDSSDAWKDFLELKDKPALTKNFDRRKYYKIAAAVILISIGVYLMKIFFVDTDTSAALPDTRAALVNEKDITEEVTMITLSSEDSVTQYSLPDNSKVSLNKNSTLQYPENFIADGRLTYLSGEGFFEVVRDTVPFIVDCNGIRTKVLGTSFEIKTNARKHVEITVTSGTVEVTNDKVPGQRMLLHQNEKGKFSDEAPFFSKETVEKKEYKWKEKRREGKIKRMIKKLKKKIH